MHSEMSTQDHDHDNMSVRSEDSVGLPSPFRANAMYSGESYELPERELSRQSTAPLAPPRTLRNLKQRSSVVDVIELRRDEDDEVLFSFS